MHLSHIPQYTIQNRIAYISVVNGVLCDIKQVHRKSSEIGHFCKYVHDYVFCAMVMDFATFAHTVHYEVDSLARGNQMIAPMSIN